MSRVVEQTEVREVMTLECLADNGQWVEKAVTAAQVAELLRTGGAQPDSEMTAGRTGGVQAARQPLCGDYREALAWLRRELPKVRGFGIDFGARIEQVPALRPLARLTLHDNQYFYQNFSGVVCLDIMNVYSEEERECIRRAVRVLPMTLMAFVGSSGMSMKVLVRVRPARLELIQTTDALNDFIRLAYKQMRVLYGNVIPQMITAAYELQVQEGVRMSYDPDVVYLPEAVPAVVDPDVVVRQPRQLRGEDADREVRLPVPANVQHRAYYDTLFERLMETVRADFVAQQRNPYEESEACLEEVIERAAQMKVSEAEVRARVARLFAYKGEKLIREKVRGVYERVAPAASTGSKVADNIQALQAVLFGGYEFQRNIINGSLYVRERTTYGRMRTVTNADLNTFVVEAQEAGVKANRQLVDALLNSTRVPPVDPVKSLVSRVRGTWDGKDRIEALARRIPCSLRQWPRWFHVWFCAMVRQWAFPDPDYANQVMPILVGPQGVGKSTFCRRLLPPALSDGYLESGDFGAEKEMLRAMSQFLLINVDEFNRYSKSEQEGILKNYIQRPDIRLKVMHRSAFEILPRRASFVATCNPLEVLADQTGSRRYICVQVTGVIRQKADIDYDQLYAQAIDEIEARQALGDKAGVRDVAGRCYFTKTEEAAIERNNQRFMRASVAIERFTLLFEPLPAHRGRQPKGSEKLTREELFNRVNVGLRKPLSDAEHTSLNNHIQNLYHQGKIGRKREGKGYLYYVKMRNNDKK